MSSPRAIAIVGLGGRFPDAPSVAALWERVLARHSASRDVSALRWPVPKEDVLQMEGGVDRSRSPNACVLDPFEVELSGLALSDDLKSRLGPLAKLAVSVGQQTWASVKSRDAMAKDRVGVILANIALPTDGASRLTESLFFSAQDERPVVAEPLERWPLAFPVGVLAQALGFGGGSFTLDAACASSLYAVHLACAELEAGRLDAVLTGGVSLPQTLYTQVGFTQLQALSPSGRCAPFDTRADGLVVGEGAGMVVLKRLEDAQRDGDTIHAVIRGLGLSNDVGGSLLSPDSEGQLRAMHAAFAQAGWTAKDVELVECHGTGTPRGDAVEVQSLTRLWADLGGGQAVLGSVKSNIGHLLTAASAAGLVKTVMALTTKTLPPSANFSAATSALGGTPFRVLEAPQPWVKPADAPRRAAVSGFGFGGINGHLLLEEYAPLAPPVTRRAPQIEPLAVVAQGAHLGGLASVDAFREALLRGESALTPRPDGRWLGLEGVMALPDGLPGGWVETFDFPTRRFRIPPRELVSLLPQQLLMLKVAAEAVDALASLKPGPQLRAGAVIGLGLDLDTTTFHLRWLAKERVRRWAAAKGERLTPEVLEGRTQELLSQLGPALDATRTLGALGGLVASRVAREFHLGGPSFTVSGEESSGLRALEVASRLLQRREVDWMLVGAVDLAGDVRQMLGAEALRPWARDGSVPFDVASTGARVGEGAVAVVLKRLADAKADGDRVLAVVRGIGASGLSVAEAGRIAHAEARIEPSRVSLFSVQGSGAPEEDARELRDVASLVGASTEARAAVSSVSAIVGQTGAVSGLASFVGAVTALSEQMVPPNAALHEPVEAAAWESAGLHVPHAPQYWPRNRSEGPRVAAVQSSGVDGSNVYVVLEGDEAPGRARPLGERSCALFLLRSDDEVLRQLAAAHEGTLESLAAVWSRRAGQGPVSRGVVADTRAHLLRQLASPAPALPVTGEVAFVFPGSGSHFVGMGRSLSAALPEVYRAQDAEVLHHRGHLTPQQTWPWRARWQPGWADEAARALGQAPEKMIVGQVAHGVAVSDALRLCGVRPAASIGYSLGESAGHFASRAWRDRDVMFGRTLTSPLFKSQLCGANTVLQGQWGEGADWYVVVVNREAGLVRGALVGTAALLIVNAPKECVVGGRRADVQATLSSLGAEGVALEGVPTVHLPVMEQVADAYRALHVLQTTPPADVRFYSAALGVAHTLTQDSAADSIIANARRGFDFQALIEQAWADGVRIFVEPGPQSSCTRMIGRILEGKPHLAVAASAKGGDEYRHVLLALARLAEAQVPVTLEALYAEVEVEPRVKRDVVTLRVAGTARPVAGKSPAARRVAPAVVLPSRSRASDSVPGASTSQPSQRPESIDPRAVGRAPVSDNALREAGASRSAHSVSAPHVFAAPQTIAAPLGAVSVAPPSFSVMPMSNHDAMKPLFETADATAKAHETFLALTAQSMALQLELMAAQQRAGRVDAGAWATALQAPVASAAQVPKPASRAVASSLAPISPPDSAPQAAAPKSLAIARAASKSAQTSGGGRPAVGTADLSLAVGAATRTVAFDRTACMEFAVGKLAAMLGPEYAPVDDYATRVRLPDEPLMLVDRILTVEGPRRVLGPGRVVTEHDVLPGAWYLDGGRAPVCISVEAGQADLFLSGYLGIDFEAKGERVYRLLDAEIAFHRALPTVGETVQYDIRIDRFIQQGDTWLFFFRFDGFIAGEPFITMSKGCAGFFSQSQLDTGKGIVDQPAPRAEGRPGTTPYAPLLPLAPTTLTEAQVEALRTGDLQAAFGDDFAGKTLAPALRLPDGRMRLVHRITQLEPTGGRFGQGLVTGEADIHPDDWFLTCHFIDDQVMPGTLMYECCLHTLRVLLLRLGWISEDGTIDLHHEPVLEQASRLKCRGQVTRHTRKVGYRIELEQVGYDPAPFVIANASMFADGRHVVQMEGMSVRIVGLTREGLEALWGAKAKAPLYTRQQILAYAEGNPSEGFGDRYKPFDSGRRLARLPRPPYLFVDRVMACEPKPWVLEPGGWVTCEYDVPPDAWYFGANGQMSLPYAVLLEAALQPCGWLAAYVGSALHSDSDLHFRNLDGQATQHLEVTPDTGRLTLRARMTKTSKAGGMILQSFDMAILANGKTIFEGDTGFGFFPSEALAQQVGVRGAKAWELGSGQRVELPRSAPLTPEETRATPMVGLELPAGAFAMVDAVTALSLDGGPQGLGFVFGEKRVDPAEWFFRAHFYQDPVMPGSLGLEALVQVMKVYARARFPALLATHRFQSMALGRAHRWQYRGQVIPTNARVEVQGVVTRVEEGEAPVITADGQLLVDGRVIYTMKDFALALVPEGR